MILTSRTLKKKDLDFLDKEYLDEDYHDVYHVLISLYHVHVVGFIKDTF